VSATFSGRKGVLGFPGLDVILLGDTPMATNLVPWTTRKRRVPASREAQSGGLLQRNLSRLVGELLASSLVPEAVTDQLSGLNERLTGYAPAVTVRKTPSQLIVAVELPGMDERDVELSLTKDELSIRGERRWLLPKVEDGEEAYSESAFGAFERVVPLTGLIVDQDRVEATSSKGVVTITLPFRYEAASGTRKVSIRPE